MINAADQGPGLPELRPTASSPTRRGTSGAARMQPAQRQASLLAWARRSRTSDASMGASPTQGRPMHQISLGGSFAISGAGIHTVIGTRTGCPETAYAPGAGFGSPPVGGGPGLIPRPQ